jgi:hypothetical protein
MKIDVQGAELMVLRGMGERLKEIDCLIAETSVMIAAAHNGPEFTEVAGFMNDPGLSCSISLPLTAALSTWLSRRWTRSSFRRRRHCAVIIAGQLKPRWPMSSCMSPLENRMSPDRPKPHGWLHYRRPLGADAAELTRGNRGSVGKEGMAQQDTRPGFERARRFCQRGINCK